MRARRLVCAVLTETLLAGTPTRTSRGIAEAMQALGGGLGASTDSELVHVGGASLSVHRRAFLELFGEVVREASFPPDEVTIERERVVQEIALLRSQPGVVASDALAARLYGDHPYGQGTPDPAAVEAVTPATLRRLHDGRIRPDHALLVLVGDLDLDRTLADVEAAFGGWATGEGAPTVAGAGGPSRRTGPARRPSGRGADDDPHRWPGAPAFRSRTTRRWRWPSPCSVAISPRGSTTTSASRRATPTAPTPGSSTAGWRPSSASPPTSAATSPPPSLVEIAYELGRMVSLPVGQAELDAARRYLQGTLAMGIQTQSGPHRLPRHPRRRRPARGVPARLPRRALDRVTVDDVLGGVTPVPEPAAR